MPRVGLWRLNSLGAAAIQNIYRQGRWVNVAAFCQAIGIARSTYYQLIGRDQWFEKATLQDKLIAIGVPEVDFVRFCEFKDDTEPADESAAPAQDVPDSRNNLPRALTSFVGRELEIAQACALLQASPLLTLTGAGGSGKTRLALRIAEELSADFPDGVWLIELACLTDSDLVVQAVADVFALRESVGKSLLETLAEHLSALRVLIVLDNCEHVLSAAAQLASELIRRCAGVRVLATSRQRLAVVGEQMFGVPTLAQPDPTLPVDVKSVSSIESIRLFVDRARLYRPSFNINEQNVDSIVSLCRRLDGIPLALELAAARVRSLSVADMLKRLETQFDLITGGDETVLPRHQTLGALIDWSYDLLNPREKLLLQRLSVFPGGWNLEAAERVAAIEPIAERDILNLLASLVDKSLVLVEDRDGAAARYRMFDTIRRYAAQKLDASGQAEHVLMRRRDWSLELAQEAEEGIRIGKDHLEWQRLLETEHDNIRAALAWSTGSAEDARVGQQLATALWRFWMIRGYSREGREHLLRALGRESGQERNTVRAQALSAASNLAFNLGDYSGARDLILESVEISEALATRSKSWEDRAEVAETYVGAGLIALRQGDPGYARKKFEKSQALYVKLLKVSRRSRDRLQLAKALTGSGRVAAELGEYVAARCYLEENLALRRELGDRREIGMALYDLSFVARKEGGYAEVQALYEECLTIRHELGDRRGVALAYYELGEAASRQLHYDAAIDFFRAGTPIFGEVGDRQHIAMCLEGMACALLYVSQVKEAVQLWGTASCLRELTGQPMEFNQRADYEEHVARARAAIGDTAFAIAWELGRSRSWEQALR